MVDDNSIGKAGKPAIELDEDDVAKAYKDTKALMDGVFNGRGAYGSPGARDADFAAGKRSVKVAWSERAKGG